MKKNISRRGYRVLAIVWTLAAASMAVAVVRRLPELNMVHLLLLAASAVAAMSFWKTYKRTPEDFQEYAPNHNSEENDNE
jgi:hypothetical protein